MNTVPIKIKRLHKDAVIPSYKHGPNEDAGMDLVSVQDIMLETLTPTKVRTGISIELPPGYECQVRPRSGLAANHGVTVLNTPGTTDPGYRGEIFVILISHVGPRKILKGDRIAQMVVAQYSAVQWEEVAELAESERGEGGLGSSGR